MGVYTCWYFFLLSNSIKQDINWNHEINYHFLDSWFIISLDCLKSFDFFSRLIIFPAFYISWFTSILSSSSLSLIYLHFYFICNTLRRSLAAVIWIITISFGTSTKVFRTQNASDDSYDPHPHPHPHAYNVFTWWTKSLYYLSSLLFILWNWSNRDLTESLFIVSRPDLQVLILMLFMLSTLLFCDKNLASIFIETTNLCKQFYIVPLFLLVPAFIHTSILVPIFF